MAPKQAGRTVGTTRSPGCRHCHGRRASTPTDLCDRCLATVYRNPADGPRAPAELRERRVAYYAERAAQGLDLHSDLVGRPV